MSVAEKNHESSAEPQVFAAQRPARSARWSAVGVWLVPLLLFVGALVVRLYRLDAQPLWLDEGQTWTEVTGRRLSTLVADLFRPTQAYPLFHLLLKFDTRLLGDSEWALRLPSALAGALAVPALWALGRELRGWMLGLGAALLLLVAPFAIWQAQDAKAYSLTLLTTVLLALTLARALRLNTRSSWLVFVAVALVAPFVHRLLVFTLLGCAVAWAIDGLGAANRRRQLQAKLVLGGALLAGIGLVAALTVTQDLQRAGGQFAAVGPLRAAWLTFGQFTIGQWPGSVTPTLLFPFAVALVVGALVLLSDLRRPQRRGALVLLALAGVPTLLFAVVLALRPFYEARYLTVIYPFWLLLLAWALPESPAPMQPEQRRAWRELLLMRLLPLWPILLLTSAGSLWLLPGSIFSGAIVKEDYRGAIAELAERAHPDDLVIVHPDSILPLYRYYAPRVTTQPLPTPKTYPWLGRSDEYQLRQLDVEIRADLRSAPRAWLVIAPDHARVVDPPIAAGDKLGLVGLAFQYGDQNQRIQCGEPQADRAAAGFVGVLLYCNNMPDVNGITPQPEVAQPALFGDDLRLRGYTVKPFAIGLRAGGTLPLSLFWEPTRSLEGSDYVVFVHLTRPDDPKPLAQIDGRPMEGGLPTGLWTLPGAELHDDRVLPLVDEQGQPLPAGRYTLRLGVYRAEDGTRLPVSGTQQPALDDALVLGEVEVLGADGQ